MNMVNYQEWKRRQSMSENYGWIRTDVERPRMQDCPCKVQFEDGSFAFWPYEVWNAETKLKGPVQWFRTPLPPAISEIEEARHCLEAWHMQRYGQLPSPITEKEMDAFRFALAWKPKQSESEPSRVSN